MTDTSVNAIRKICNGTRLEQQFTASEVGANPIDWLRQQLSDGMYLLAHSDDGIVWGKVVNGVLQFPKFSNYQQAAFCSVTLQMARLFDHQRQIFLWRAHESAWMACVTADDAAGEKVQYFDEDQVLWGTRVEESDGQFSLVADGSQGLRHAFPTALPRNDFNGHHPFRLMVRHYLKADSDGWLRIVNSRLTGIAW